MSQDLVRVFVGADRSQALAVDVLAYSIRRHTDMKVDVVSMADVILPEPQDIRQGSRTNFSFTRFAIPALCNYQGRAIYMDADMQVFKDIRGLWEVPFEGREKIQILEDIPEEFQPKEGQLGAPSRRKKQSSVMVLDCGKLNWVAEDIISGLDGRYTYDELLSEICILEPDEIGWRVPWVWNSLETYIEGTTALTHYTDMFIQPWVSNQNPIGWVWINEVRRMLSEGALSWSQIEEEIKLGYFRPSLLTELKMNDDLSVPDAARTARLEEIDAKAGFVKHAEVYQKKRERKKAIAAYEAQLAAQAAE
ncbi:MAG: glycosyl transferase [Hyphomonas sp.]|uniref:glycosyltransferase n=1 Tax=Hyphomonas sp. TaxID=87 RepID=UPI001D3FA535|nr:glycosyltransferase [Hyphomonas sp.]MBA4226641.1 glycosyl transferase [Hyphomonas sp.]